MKVSIIYFGTPYICQIEPYQSLYVFQEEISNNTSVPAHKQHLIFHGQIISDGDSSVSIGSFGIREDSKIFLFNKSNCNIVFVKLLYQKDTLSLMLPDNILIKVIKTIFIDYLQSMKNVNEQRITYINDHDMNSPLKDVLFKNPTNELQFIYYDTQKKLVYTHDERFSPASYINNQGKICKASEDEMDEESSFDNLLPKTPNELCLLTTYIFENENKTMASFCTEFSQHNLDIYDVFDFNNVTLSEDEVLLLARTLTLTKCNKTKHFLFWNTKMSVSAASQLFSVTTSVLRRLSTKPVVTPNVSSPLASHVSDIEGPLDTDVSSVTDAASSVSQVISTHSSLVPSPICITETENLNIQPFPVSLHNSNSSINRHSSPSKHNIHFYGWIFWKDLFSQSSISQILPQFENPEPKEIIIKDQRFTPTQWVHLISGFYYIKTEFIQTIDFTNTYIGDRVLQLLSNIFVDNKFSNLINIIFKKTHVSNQGIMYFTPLFKQKRILNLQTLDFSYNDINSQGIWMILFCLVEGDLNNTITSLKFAHNDIGNTGINQISHILQISPFPELLEFDLSYNRISSDGLKALLNALCDHKVENLRIINCEHNLINDDCINAFISFMNKKCCPCFCMIYFEDNNISFEGYQKLNIFSNNIHNYPKIMLSFSSNNLRTSTNHMTNSEKTKHNSNNNRNNSPPEIIVESHGCCTVL